MKRKATLALKANAKMDSLFFFAIYCYFMRYQASQETENCPNLIQEISHSTPEKNQFSYSSNEWLLIIFYQHFSKTQANVVVIN